MTEPAPLRIVSRDVIDVDRVVRVLGPAWLAPKAYGADNWQFQTRLVGAAGRTIIVGVWGEPDGVDWIHASMSRFNGLPDYDDLKMLHKACFGDGYAYQCFVPSNRHINITFNVLHLWGRVDGQPVLPDFGRFGTI